MRLGRLFAPLLMATVLGGCASQYSMAPDEKSATDSLQLVESGESFMLAGTVAFKPANREDRLILGHGRYVKIMTSSGGDFYMGMPRNIQLRQGNGFPEIRRGGIYVPHNHDRLCLVFWMQYRPETAGGSSRTGYYRLADTYKITFYTWINRSITAIPLCNN